jgi:hypothetical protein
MKTEGPLSCSQQPATGPDFFTVRSYPQDGGTIVGCPRLIIK